mmetsp:Transcript_110093/g.350710  ORF Transcript_110093/g.350710 Transcript_110093/m.350710 type:complete len:286 (-) Transcript_110093:328-1185(-)
MKECCSSTVSASGRCCMPMSFFIWSGTTGVASSSWSARAFPASSPGVVARRPSRGQTRWRPVSLASKRYSIFGCCMPQATRSAACSFVPPGSIVPTFLAASPSWSHRFFFFRSTDGWPSIFTGLNRENLVERLRRGGLREVLSSLLLAEPWHQHVIHQADGNDANEAKAADAAEEAEEAEEAESDDANESEEAEKAEVAEGHDANADEALWFFEYVHWEVGPDENTLVVLGDCDALSLPETAQWLKEEYPRVRVATHSGHGSICFPPHSKWLAEVLANFFDAERS